MEEQHFENSKLCNTVQRNLCDYIEAECNNDLKFLIKAHILNCDFCYEKYQIEFERRGIGYMIKDELGKLSLRLWDLVDNDEDIKETLSFNVGGAVAIMKEVKSSIKGVYLSQILKHTLDIITEGDKYGRKYEKLNKICPIFNKGIVTLMYGVRDGTIGLKDEIGNEFNLFQYKSSKIDGNLCMNNYLILQNNSTYSPWLAYYELIKKKPLHIIKKLIKKEQ